VKSILLQKVYSTTTSSDTFAFLYFQINLTEACHLNLMGFIQKNVAWVQVVMNQSKSVYKPKAQRKLSSIFQRTRGVVGGWKRNLMLGDEANIRFHERRGQVDDCFNERWPRFFNVNGHFWGHLTF
jgi:hypothetical protein